MRLPWLLSYYTSDSVLVAATPSDLRHSDATAEDHSNSLSRGGACGWFQKDVRADVCLTPAVGPADGDMQEFGCTLAAKQCHLTSRARCTSDPQVLCGRSMQARTDNKQA